MGAEESASLVWTNTHVDACSWGSDMISSRRLAISAVALAVLGALLPACHGPGNGGFVFDWNIWGYKGNTAYNPDVVSALVNTISAQDPKPQYIMLQEVCSNQLAQLAAQLPEYSSASYLQHPLGKPNCQSFGNAMFFLGNADSVSYGLYPVNPNYEQRGYVCNVATVGGRSDIKACSTHLDLDASSSAQATYMRTTVAPHIAAGDYNITPGHSGTAALNDYRNNGWTEATSGAGELSTSSTTDGGSRRDYIWFRAPFTADLLARITPRAESDHHTYEGWSST
ncbi:MAG: endonuclease/exonuclease/phosphatase family protein [Candidatus Microthrix sp.]|nr:endonuclease/exonuclease/phosphatase family protein [Candidatus Microthrix sp.]